MASKKRFKKYDEINFDHATRKDLLSLIHWYLKNEIDVEQFTHDIAIGFTQEWNGLEGYFNSIEYAEIDKIFEVCDWFSPFEADHEAYSGYTTADQVRTTVENAAQILPVL